MTPMALPERETYTEAEYLTFERESEFKHEYIDGQILAMMGGTGNHSMIAVAIAVTIGNQLDERKCRPFNSDMRVRALNAYTYPDFSVVCGEVQYADEREDTVLNPTLIIEVLSPSTEGFDRGEKFQRYRWIPSLQEYVLVAQNRPYIERFTRQPSGEWLLAEAMGLDATIDLPAIGCSLPLTSVYRYVRFD